jgi:7-cyano-7-deazaguanine synthase
MTRDGALVLFSGGQDSTTCLAWALEHFDAVETIGFDYGQRHRIELSCRKVVLDFIATDFPGWAPKLGEDHMLDIPVLSRISDTALTRDVQIAFEGNGLPNTFVPGRNLLFLTLAGAVAYRRGLRTLVGGMCETDYSGYPDCREATMTAMQSALALGLDASMEIQTPLMHLTKAETWNLAQELGGNRLTELIIAETHTCYLGERGILHSWGFGCGTCPACELRAKGYAQWQVAV